MKRVLVAVAALAMAAPAFAQDAEATGQEEARPKAEVVSVGEDGRPEIVRIEGREYRVCKGDENDGCINPRDAGFDWGGKELDYWPGRPASEIDEPLPGHKPEAPKDPD